MPAESFALHLSVIRKIDNDKQKKNHWIQMPALSTWSIWFSAGPSLNPLSAPRECSTHSVRCAARGVPGSLSLLSRQVVPIIYPPTAQ